VNKQVGK